MYRALAAAFLLGLAPAYAGVQPAAAVLSAPPAGQVWKTYYYAPGLVAMREITATGNVLYYLHQDHLGSTSLATNASGVEQPNTKQSYYPFGAVRVAGTGLPTDITFTGQRADDTGLMHYGARYYSPYLNRWIQPDTIVPDPSNPQDLNRYSYARNNPVKYVDPTGHFSEDEIQRFFDKESWEDVLKLFQEGGELEGRWGWLAILQKAEIGDFVSVEWDKRIALPAGHPNFGDSFTGEFLADPNGNLIIYGQDYYIDHRKAAHYGKEFGLVHDHPGDIGERLSLWSASATDRELKWVGSKTDFIGRFGPPPGKHVDPMGKGLTVGFTLVGAGEVFHLGELSIASAPTMGPAAPVAIGTGLAMWAVAAVLTIIAVNTASAP